MPKTRFDVAKPKIADYFYNMTRRVHSPKQLITILAEQRNVWNLPDGLSGKKFIELMMGKLELKSVDLIYSSIEFTRYVWGEATPFEIAVSLRPKSYLTHYSAAYLHGLTLQIPKVVYVNAEQPKKPKKGKLSQSAINGAFRRPPRDTNTLAELGDTKVALLMGQYTGQLGVIDMTMDDRYQIQVTNLERTLIDMTVRPTYSGGVFEVLNAFRSAARLGLSVNKLSALLQNLEFVYPYHQAIGFYLDVAGQFSDSQIQHFGQFNREFDFYLTHQMKDPAYSETWRIFYPRGLTEQRM